MAKQKVYERGMFKYPLYFNVDDLPVTVVLDGNDAVGKMPNGKPYPLGKAYVNGFEITKREYDKLVEALPS